MPNPNLKNMSSTSQKARSRIDTFDLFPQKSFSFFMYAISVFKSNDKTFFGYA